MPGSDRAPPTEVGEPTAGSMGPPASMGLSQAGGGPAPKRQRPSKGEPSDSDSDSSDGGGDDSPGASTSGGTGKDPTVRLSLRKEKKSAREKARRQRENALFDELANMCNVPPDMRDKSSVLKAVIKRVEELKTRGGGSGFTASSLLSALGGLSPSSSYGSLTGLTTAPSPAQVAPQTMFDERLYMNARSASGTAPGWAGNPASSTTFPMYAPQPLVQGGAAYAGGFHPGQFSQQVMGPPPVNNASANSLPFIPSLALSTAAGGGYATKSNGQQQAQPGFTGFALSGMLDHASMLMPPPPSGPNLVQGLASVQQQQQQMSAQQSSNGTKTTGNAAGFVRRESFEISPSYNLA